MHFFRLTGKPFILSHLPPVQTTWHFELALQISFSHMGVVQFLPCQPFRHRHTLKRSVSTTRRSAIDRYSPSSPPRVRNVQPSSCPSGIFNGTTNTSTSPVLSWLLVKLCIRDRRLAATCTRHEYLRNVDSIDKWGTA